MTEDPRSVIERLFRQYGRGVSSYLLVRLGDAELAEEITSRVFLLVVRQFSQLRGPPVGWLWAIVRSELARHYRDHRQHAPLMEDLADSRELPPEQLAREQARQQLQAALDLLPQDLHEIVYMKFFLNLSNQEIARATGLTPSNVGVKVHRTLKQLRGLLAGLADTRPVTGEEKLT